MSATARTIPAASNAARTAPKPGATAGPATPGRNSPALGEDQPMFHRVLRADAMEVRRALIDMTHRFQSIGPDRLSRLELALAEVLNNIVEHGYADRPSGLIHVSVVPGENGLSCAVADNGRALPTECLGPRHDPLPPSAADTASNVLHLPEGGFGWLLIQGLTQNLCHYHEDGRNILAFFMPFDTVISGSPSDNVLR